MTIAKVINVGAEQLIALPTGFHIDAKQVSISKRDNSFLITIPTTNTKPNIDVLDKQASFLAWRKAYEATFDELDNQNWESPWENLRAKENGREFNWEA